MKATRLITFPLIYLVLEPFFLYWYIMDKIRSRRAKFYIIQELYGASAYGTRKQRGRLYKNWLKGEPYDIVFRLTNEEKDDEVP